MGRRRSSSSSSDGSRERGRKRADRSSSSSDSDDRGKRYKDKRRQQRRKSSSSSSNDDRSRRRVEEKRQRKRSCDSIGEDKRHQKKNQIRRERSSDRMNKKDRNKRHRRRSSNSSSSSIEKKRDDKKREELKKNEKEVERKKEQAGRLMALAHSGSGASKEETGRWKQEPQENLKEFRSTKGSTWGGKGREEKNDSYMGNRRTQREEIGERGANEVWAKSPTRDEEDSDLYSEPENMDIDEGKDGKKEKKSKKSKKSKKEKKDKKDKKEKKSKKEKKHKKKSKKKQKDSSSDSSSDDEWIEKDVMESVAEGKKIQSEESDEEIIGPVLPQKIQLSHKELGTQLLRGEGEAMAAYIEDGKRIPRRGEIGLTADEIVRYEDEGWVMSGSRHRRMEAVRLRKENQIYSADEKRALAMFTKEGRDEKEKKILGQFKEMVNEKLKKK